VENILQAFLDAGLLDMVDEDEKLKHLQDAAHDLAEKPSKNRIDLIKSTLVALDAEVPSTEPEFERVEGALKKHWKTIKAKFNDVPRQLLRGILLESLRRRAEMDVKTAAIVWLTGSSYFPHTKPARDKEVCESFLLEMGKKVEANAAKEWLGGYEYSSPKIPGLEVNLEAKPPTINSEDLTKQLAAAVGPKNADNEDTGPDPNTIWPQQNGQAWAQRFAPRAATGISQVVNKSMAELFKVITETVRQSSAGLTANVSAINSAIESAVTRVASGAAIAERRGNLLWWRQTLYSPTLMVSYRELDLPTAVVAMGHDLHAQIPDFYPHSLEFLLREAVRQVEQQNQNSKKISLVEFGKTLKASTHAPVLLKVVGLAGNETGRVPLLNAVKKALEGEALDSSQIAESIGIAGKLEIDFQELAVWIFRDIQAHAIATQKG
jgi:hypothetical protein